MRAKATLIVGVSAALAGCGSSQPAARAPQPVAGQLAAALFHNGRYEADGRALFRARSELVRGCMARRGFAYRADDGALPPPPAPVVPSLRDGYGLFARVSAVDPDVLRAARNPSSSANARYLRALSAPRRAAYEHALGGSSRAVRSVRVPGAPALSYQTSGCYARAIARLDGSLAGYYTQLAAQNEVAITVNRELARDRRLTRSLMAWRTCMRARGFAYRTPGDARDAVYDAYIRAPDRTRVRRRELATASADRACGLRSAFYDEQGRARDRALRSLSARHVRWMLAFARSRAAATRRARTILASAD
jgi:hypothetical protein